MQSHLPSFFLSFLGLCLFLSCGSVIEPDFKGIENAKMTQTGLSQSSLFIDLHYFNPNKSRLALKSAEGDAWIEGIPLGHFIVDTMIRIPANADFRVPLELKLDMTHYLQNMATVLSNKEVAVKIEGRARVGKSGVFINRSINYEGRKNLSEFLKQKIPATRE